MTFYCEYALKPHLRNGAMIPVSSLPKIYERNDAGYSSYYWFRQPAANDIIAQGNSAGLSRFSVYSQYLVLDIDRENDLSQAYDDMRLYSLELEAMQLKHSVWVSGGKGYHIYIHCVPIEGIDVPYSQLAWVQQQNWKVDLTLYQHGRLLSNPGRKSDKTGIRKYKLSDFNGELLNIPRVAVPERFIPACHLLAPDLARIALYRIQKTFESQPSSRHTALWSLAGSCAEAGMPMELCVELLGWMNQMWETPKDSAGLERAIKQGYSQARTSPSP